MPAICLNKRSGYNKGYKNKKLTLWNPRQFNVFKWSGRQDLNLFSPRILVDLPRIKKKKSLIYNGLRDLGRIGKNLRERKGIQKGYTEK